MNEFEKVLEKPRRPAGPNPILADALEYHAERRMMNNPKGWDHVLRVVRECYSKGLWPTADQEQVIHALGVLESLVTSTAEPKGS